MKATGARTPENEAERLAALLRCGVLDKAEEPAFAEFTAAAAAVCGTPMALISLAGRDRQWFKSRVGVDLWETPREVSFCAHAILEPEVMLVPDARADARFATNPLVTGGPLIRFYAGAPLVVEGGHAVGTLCVLDSVSRTLSDAQTRVLATLARQVVMHLELRRRHRAEMAWSAASVMRLANEIGRLMTESPSLEAALEPALVRILGATGWAAGAVWRPREDGQGLELLAELRAGDGGGDGARAGAAADRSPLLAGRAWSTGAPCWQPAQPAHAAQGAADDDARRPQHASAAVPLLVHDRVVAVLEFADEGSRQEGDGFLALAATLSERVSFVLGRRAEDQRLRQAEARFRAVTETAHDGIVSADRAGRITYVNPAALRLLGYAEGDLLGQPLTVLLPARIHLAAERAFERMSRKERTRLFDKTLAVRALTKAGTERDVELTLAASVETDDTRFTAILRDVTERRRLEEQLREQEARFQAFMDNAPTVAFMKDAAGRFIYVNRRFEQVFRMERKDWLGRTDYELWSPEVAETLRAHDDRVLTQREVLEVEENVRTPDGKSTEWLSLKFPFIVNGAATLAGIAVDVTALKTAERELKDEKRRLVALLQNSSDVVTVVAPDRTLIYVSHSVLNVLGVPPAEMQGKPFGVRVHPDDRYLLEALFIRGGVGGNAPQKEAERSPPPTTVVRALHADGTHRHLEFRATDATADTAIGGTIMHARDITAQKRYEAWILEQSDQLKVANAQLERLATIDELTGLRNRRAVDERLASEIQRAKRYGLPLTVALIDLDHFKGINDTFGHQEGDQVLQTVGRILAEEVRNIDVAGRYGGEEFIVLIPSTGAAGARVIAERLRHAIASYPWPKRPLTASIGIATYDESLPEGKLIALADAALYRAKNEGRNRVVTA